MNKDGRLFPGSLLPLYVVYSLPITKFCLLRINKSKNAGPNSLSTVVLQHVLLRLNISAGNSSYYISVPSAEVYASEEKQLL